MRRRRGSLRLLILTLLALVCASGAYALSAGEKASADRCLGEALTEAGTGGADRIVGTPGDDVIDGRGGDDRIIGGDGDDVLCGAGGADQITAGAGADSVSGGAGRDDIETRRGGDWARGGVGRDILDGDGNRDVLAGNAGPDLVKGRSGQDHLFGGAGDDDIYGGAAVDRCTGGSGANLLNSCERPRTTPPPDPPGPGGGAGPGPGPGSGPAPARAPPPDPEPQNRPPRATDDVAAVGEDTAIAVAVRGNDSDPDGDALKITATRGSPTGAVSITGAGAAIRFDSAGAFDDLPAGATRDDAFTYRISDGNGGSDTGRVTVTVTGNDDAPKAVTDQRAATEDDAVTQLDVLANDTDVDGGPILITATGATPNATVGSAAGGTVIDYTPDPDFCGPDTFTYTITGGSTATVGVNVACVDDPGTANGDSFTVTEDSGASPVGVGANDSDVDGSQIQSVTQAANGVIAITGGGTGLTYAPDPGYCNDGGSTDDFTYTVTGGSTANVAMTVTCVNDAPVNTVPGSQTTAEDTPLVLGDASAISVADSDAGGNPLSITLTSTNGTLTLGGSVGLTVSGDGTGSVTASGSISALNDGLDGLTFTPSSDFNGPASIQLQTSDQGASGSGGAQSDTDTVPVTITAADDLPVAADDTRELDEDAGATTINVLANDADADGGPKSIATKTDPANGSVAITSGGADLTYTPDANYCNDPPGTTPDTFTYTLNGGSTATVSVTVDCIDDSPVAVGDTASVPMDAPATTVNVLANDSDVDGGPKTIAGVTQPVNGEVAITNAGADLTYEPDAGYCNDGSPTDDFTYTLDEGGSTATVAVTVPCNAPPSAAADSGTTGENTTSTVTAPGVLANDTDADPGDALSVGEAGGSASNVGSSFNSAKGAAVTLNGDGSYSYDPSGSSTLQALAQGSSTTDTFTYKAKDDAGALSSLATVTITVNGANDAPVAVDDSANVGEDTSIAFNAANGLLANDTDVDTADTKTVAEVRGSDANVGSPTTSAKGAVITVNADGSYSYNPTASATLQALPAGQQTTDTFTYKAKDGQNAVSNLATVTITVGGVADNPVAVDDTATVNEDTGTTNLGVAANDTDADDPDEIEIESVSDPAGGTTAIVQGSPDQVSYTPDNNFCTGGGATDDFTYTVNGGDTATVKVTVTCVNDAPVAVADSGATNEDATLSTPAPGVLANDTDVDAGDSKSVAEVNGSAASVGTPVATSQGASVTVNANGSYAYNPSGSSALQALNVGQQLVDTFTYKLKDAANATSNQVTVSITVAGVNDNPVADSENLTGANSAVGNTVLTVNMTAGAPRKAISDTSLNVLQGDTDIDGPGPLVAGPTGAKAITTADGGKVTLEADGDFTYFPDANTPSCTDTSDSFTYTVSDQAPGTAGTGTGTVTIAIAGCVWYANNALGANGIGTSDSPFNSLDPINDSPATTDADGTSDTIYLLGFGGYSGGLPLEASQRLVSERFGLVVGNDTLAAPGGSNNPTISNAAGNAVTLASDNTIQGINFGATNAASASLAGSGIGTATVNTATNGSGQIANTSGSAVDLSTGTLSMAFTSVSSSNATSDGIRLDNTSGTFAASGGSLQNAGGQAVDISGNGSGDDVAFTYDGTISDPSGTVVSVANQTGGTKDFNGAIGTAANPAGAVSLSTNPGATVRFDGGVLLSTGATGALSATGGGTVIVTDPNAVGTAPDNVLTTSTGTALNVVNTTIGSGGLSFKSISSNGAPNGIALQNTGSTAGLTVTGTGTAASGGTIGGSTGPGMLVSGTANLSLTSIRIANGGDDGIRGSNVSGLTLSGSEVSSNGNANNENGLDFTGLTGTVNLTNSSVTGSGFRNISIINDAGTLNATVSGGSYSSTKNSATGGDSIFVEGTGSGTMNLTVENATFSQNGEDHVQVTADSVNTVSQNVTIQGNTMSNTVGGSGGGITLNPGGNATMEASVLNNSITGANLESITVDTPGSQISPQPAQVDATISGNTIGQTGVNMSGGGNGIGVRSNGAATVKALVTNNTVTQYVQVGIDILQNDGNGSLNLTMRGNTVTKPGVTGENEPLQFGVFALIGSGPDTGTSCLDIGGAGALANNLTASSSSSPTFTDPNLRFAMNGAATAQLAGYGGAATDNAAVNTYLAARNTAPNGVSTTRAVNSKFAQVASCPLP